MQHLKLSHCKHNISSRKKRLLDAKYRIFMESIEIQRWWKQDMDHAFADDVVDQDSQ